MALNQHQSPGLAFKRLAVSYSWKAHSGRSQFLYISDPSVIAVIQGSRVGHMERMDKESCLAIMWGRTEKPF